MMHTIILKILDGDDLSNATRLVKRQKRQPEAIKRLHEACGHRSVGRLINLKRLGRSMAANLPSHFLREFKKQCPTCLATSRKTKALPMRCYPGYTEEIHFEDAMKWIARSWWAKEACAVAMAEFRSMLEALATACALSVECVDMNCT